MKEVISFLSELSKNNNKDWFAANRDKYESAKNTVLILVDELIQSISKFDPAIANQNAKSCLFRINKDVRFSKDKSPYKLNFGASISPGGRKSSTPGYYIQIQPGASFLAGGTYQPLPDQLYAIRQEIDYNLEEFKSIVSDKKFKKLFGKLAEEDTLKNAPKGFDKDSESLEYIRNRHFIVIHSLTDEELCAKNFAKKCTEVFEEMKPLNYFLRRSFE